MRPYHQMSSPTVIRLRRLRRLSQALFLCAFLLFLLRTSYSGRTLDLAAVEITTPAPVNSFFNFDPLISLAFLISAHTWYAGFVLSLLTLAATMVLGRFFCGWVCPFGTLHHIFGNLGTRGNPLHRMLMKGEHYRRLQALKYYLLIFLLLTAAFSYLQPAALDPLCLLARSCILSVFPSINFLTNRLLALGMDSGAPFLSVPAEWIYRYFSAREWIGRELFYRSALITGIIFVILLLANLVITRFWCRFLCPLGALFASVSRFSLVRVRKDDARCTSCARCLIFCQGGRPRGEVLLKSPSEAEGSQSKGSLSESGIKCKTPECLLCLNCAAECPDDALGFEFLGVRDSSECAPDLTRRGLIMSIGASLFAIPLLRATRGMVNRSRLIRPPGARPEGDFLSTCLRCGACTRICPTGAIHSSIAEAGLEGFWTPRLIPRTGYCVYSCTLCGQVCPSQAIRKLGAEQKMGSERFRPVKLGTAAVDRNRCIPWARSMSCIACEEVCPVSPKAIKLDEAAVKGPTGERFILRRPVVDARACIGCGHCEYVCPVEGAAAIRVFSAGESRAEEI